MCFIGFCVVGTLHHHPFSPKLEILRKMQMQNRQKKLERSEESECKVSRGISASKRKVCEIPCSIINVQNISLATSFALIKKLMDMAGLKRRLINIAFLFSDPDLVDPIVLHTRMFVRHLKT